MPKCCEPVSYPNIATLQTDTSTDDNPAESFVATVAGMPIKVTAISGDETWRGRQLESHIDYVVETPWRTGVTSKQRLAMSGGIYDGRTLNIEYAKPLQLPGHPPKLELYCTERIA